MQKKKMALAVNSAITDPNNQKVKTIEDLLVEQPVFWVALDELRDSLNPHVMELTAQINGIINNKEILDNLGTYKTMFDKFVSIFIKDMDTFSNNVANLRNKHANKSGQILTDNDYAEYMNLGFEYQNLYMNIVAVTTPIMVQLIDIISSVQASQAAKQVPAPTTIQ